MRVVLTTLGASIMILLASVTGVAAQSLSPMRAQVTSIADQFAIRVYPGNPYNKRVKINIKVYDHNFQEIRAIIQPRDLYLAAGQRRSVTVIIPFEGRFSRKIRICAETTPYLQNQARLRGQVCGRYFGRRVG